MKIKEIFSLLVLNTDMLTLWLVLLELGWLSLVCSLSCLQLAFCRATSGG